MTTFNFRLKNAARLGGNAMSIRTRLAASVCIGSLLIGSSASAGYVRNNPLNQTDPTGQAAVWVKQPDGSSVLVIPVKYDGAGATPAAVKGIVDRANGLTIVGGNTSIQVVATDKPVGGVLNHMDFSPGYNNSMCGAAGECVNKLGGDQAHINSANPQSTDAGAHDTLHFAGVKDQYVEGPRDAAGNRTSTPAPGYTDANIMTSRSGTQITGGQLQDAQTNTTTKHCTGTPGNPQC